MTTIELDAAPGLGALLLKAALPRRRGGSTLPDTEVALRGVTIDTDHLADYAEVCGFRLEDTLPPTYLHLLGFPLSVSLMARPDFPVPLLGAVHIGNTITQHRPVGIGETLDLSGSVRDLRPHPKGRQLDNVVVARVGDEVVWESVSTYLSRGPGGDEAAGEATGAAALDLSELPLTALWRVPADIGRRYAPVSGDRNPIHLSALTARPLGFKRAIAHGMWTKARALAMLQGRLPESMTIDVAFKLPLFLPSTVEFASHERSDGWAFGVRSRDGKPHMAGLIHTQM